VRALGFSIEGGRRAQVSMNLVNTEATPIHRVLGLLRAEAARWGAAVSGCEVVGLIPEAALLDAAEHALQLESFRRDQVLEFRLRHPPTTEAVTLAGFFDQVAAPAPTPGGGTAAAVAGALAASLTAMVAGLTVGRKKYAGSEAVMNETLREAAVLRRALMSLAREDSQAFEAVVKARQMPQVTPAEAEARAKATQAANLEASRVPLRTAEACLKVLELAAQAARLGNANAVTDAGTAGLLARAAAEGALLNVEINLKSSPAGADKNDVETALQRVRSALGPAAQRCADAVHSALKA
jgi:glutamate formiminotransferase/formiminotetrahydrofolate cyclodeaminase